MEDSLRTPAPAGSPSGPIQDVWSHCSGSLSIVSAFGWGVSLFRMVPKRQLQKGMATPRPETQTLCEHKNPGQIRRGHFYSRSSRGKRHKQSPSTEKPVKECADLPSNPRAEQRPGTSSSWAVYGPTPLLVCLSRQQDLLVRGGGESELQSSLLSPRHKSQYMHIYT